MSLRDKTKFVAYGGAAKLFTCVAPEVLYEGPANCFGALMRVYNPVTGEHVPIGELAALGEPTWVQTLRGPRRATAPTVTGRGRMCRVTTESGLVVEVAAKHRFLTPKGWTLATELVPGRSVVLRRDGEGDPFLSSCDSTSKAGPRSLGDLSLSGDEILSWAQCSSSWDPVGSIEALGIEPYYDLHVPGEEHYLGEGLWNHNSGKTRALLERCYLLLTEFPGIRMLWLRKTRASLTDSVLVTWEEHVLPEGHPCIHGKAGREHRSSYKFPNGSVVVLGGMDKSRKVMSTEYDIICYFEGTDGDLLDWLRLITRARNKRILLGTNKATGKPVYFHQVIADVNPAGEYHWLNQRANDPMIQMERIKATHADNPNFDEDDQARLDSLVGATRRRLRDGEWCQEDGQVWECWDPATMMCMREDLLINKRRPHGGYRCEWYFGSLDFGMAHAQVFQIWGVIGDRIYRVVEIYKREKSHKWWGDKIAFQMQKWPLHTIVADGGGLGKTLISDLNDRLGSRGGNSQLGIIRPARKGPGSRLLGFKQVHAKMEQGQIILCHDAQEYGPCQVSIDAMQPTSTEREIPSLTWAKGKEGGPRSRDDSDRSCVDDGCFAMIYAVDWFWGREDGDEPSKNTTYGPDTIGAMIDHARWKKEVERKERYG